MLSHDLQVYYHQSWKRRVAGEGAYWVLAGSQDHASMSFWASQLRDSEWLEWHLENPRMMIHDDSWWSMTYDWSRTFHMNCHIHACKMCFGVSKRKSWTPGGKWCQLGSATRSWRQHLLEQPRAPDSILWVGPFWVWPRSWSCQQHWNRWLEGIVEKILETGFKQIENNKDFSTSKEIYGHPMDHGFPRDPFWMDYHHLPTNCDFSSCIDRSCMPMDSPDVFWVESIIAACAAFPTSGSEVNDCNKWCIEPYICT